MEIERKFLINELPFSLNNYSKDIITQGYISTSPVIRIRQKSSTYYLTCKSKGFMSREEFEIKITKEEYNSLKNKIDYNMIIKERYYIPTHEDLCIELDIFQGALAGLIIAEVEFTSIEQAESFIPPIWFSKELTRDSRFFNSYLCRLSNISGLLD